MAQSQFGKYIVTDLNKVADSRGTRVYCMHGGCSRVRPMSTAPGFGRSRGGDGCGQGARARFREAVTFFGSNPEDPTDLGGEIEFWLEEEKHTITRSCVIFVPPGIRHCP